MANTEMVSSRNAMRAIFIQPFLSCNSFMLVALKKAMVATNDATKESIAKKCPDCPGNKCSPKYSMFTFDFYAYFIFINLLQYLLPFLQHSYRLYTLKDILKECHDIRNNHLAPCLLKQACHFFQYQ